MLEGKIRYPYSSQTFTTIVSAVTDLGIYTMDFIEGLPTSHGKNIILAVVDQLSKSTHFAALSHPYTAKIVVELLLPNRTACHGPLLVIRIPSL